MKKAEMLRLGDFIFQYDADSEQDHITDRICNIITDMIDFKLKYKPKLSEDSLKTSVNNLTILYENPAIGFINLQKILKDEDVNSIIRPYVDKQEMVVYSYTKSIRGKVFNYNRMLENIDVDDWDSQEHICNCNDEIYSKFVDKDHGHVITGNLDIIKDKKLRNLFKKGPNFRERNSINFERAKSAIAKGLDSYINKWSNRKRIAREVFIEWKLKVLEKVDNQIKKLRTGPLKQWRPCKKVLNDKCSKQTLQVLQENFIIVPIDKASNNIGFVCKTYMISNVIKEIKSNTYKELGDVTEITKSQIDACIKVGGQVKPDCQKLPTIYATIKMHKKPVKFRYIIAAKKCVSKTIAKDLTQILKLVMKIMYKYCEKIKLYTGVNRMWISESAKDILEDIDTLNQKKRGKNIQTFDFSTLYTKINLEDLSEKLKWIINKAFCGGSNQWIRIQHDNAKFDNGASSKSGKLFSKEDVYRLVDFIIDNAVFSAGNKVFQQIIGIPMGTDPAPFMANLYLFYYEFKYMEMLTKKDYITARRQYGHIRRFIDDLAALNNSGHLGEHWSEIYPVELILNKENEDDNNASFLDLDISIQDKVFHTQIFDKRDAFNFEIVNYPDISGNIPENPAYGVCIAQLLRIARNTSHADCFLHRAQLLFSKLLHKGYLATKLQKTTTKCLTRHWKVFSKYGIGQDSILTNISTMIS